jgi:hypothetical protein
VMGEWRKFHNVHMWVHVHSCECEWESQYFFAQNSLTLLHRILGISFFFSFFFHCSSPTSPCR